LPGQFYDGFYAAPSAEALRGEPPLLAGSSAVGMGEDAYLAATAEELARTDK
jgi:hypothetical protein